MDQLIRRDAISRYFTRRDDNGDNGGDSSLPVHPDDLKADHISRYEMIIQFRRDGASMTEAAFQEELKADPSFELWCIASGYIPVTQSLMRRG